MFKLWLLLGSLSLVLPSFADKGCFKLRNETCPNANVRFRLYSYEDPYGRAIDPKSFQGTEFEIVKQLKVLLHDFGGNGDSTPNRELRPHLITFRHLSVLTVDYANLVLTPCYVESVHNVPYVGRCVAEFLGNLMHNRRLVANHLHIIGFGIGAHVASYVANFLKEVNLSVGHITGLDPAKHLYLNPDVSTRLDPTDADFVDVIHTDVLLHGMLQPLGHVDFYPNQGITQPNCGPVTDIYTHECYHKRAAEYYAESISSLKGFWSFHCSDIYSFLVGKCQPYEDFELLGFHVSHKARGNYFLGTNDKSPFARGKSFDGLKRVLQGETYLGTDIFSLFKDMGSDNKNLTLF